MSSYNGPEAGRYPVEEHLRAQQEQISPVTGKPMHPEVTGADPADPEKRPTPDNPQAPAPTDTGDTADQDQHDDGGTQ